MGETVSLLGIRVHSLNKEGMVDAIVRLTESPRPACAFYINAHCVNIACSDPDYRSALNAADLVYSGGMGVIWAASFLGAPLPERVNILDFFDKLAEKLRERKTPVYLLGGEPDVSAAAGRALKERGLNIVGSSQGFLDASEEAKVIREIRELRPALLIVGMGVPKQERWIMAHRGSLNVNLCWGVGAAFEWLSGRRDRAPGWMVRNGLEWLHRLYQQPSRLWKRYLVGNPVFVYRVLCAKWRLITRSHSDIRYE
ncbi:MAG: WecB/TagA/CpsF family glycosyltransferase [Deltaproteobacteria bacterium]